MRNRPADVVEMKKFETGKRVYTEGIAALMERGFDLRYHVARHQSGDWGDCDSHDKKINDEAVKRGAGLLVSVYETEFGTVGIITEADRSVTTVLLPIER